jgi:penicillin-binding protein 1A
VKNRTTFRNPSPIQGALVSLDPHSGGIRALVGGRDFKESQFNRAISSQTPTGIDLQTVRVVNGLGRRNDRRHHCRRLPIAYTDMEHNPRLVAEATDYATLMQMVTDYYKVPRAPDAPDPIWAPQNWDNKFLGPISLRRGFALIAEPGVGSADRSRGPESGGQHGPSSRDHQAPWTPCCLWDWAPRL